MSLATSGPQGVWASTVFYVNDGFVLYFLSRGDTRHVKDMESDPHVAATVSEDAVSWRQVRGVQLEGRASRVEDPKLRRGVLALFQRRFAFADSLWWTDAPPLPGAAQHVYRVEPERVLFLDHQVRHDRFEIPAALIASRPRDVAAANAAAHRQQPRPRERDRDELREAEPSPNRPAPAEGERERTSDDLGDDEEHGLPPAPRERIEE